MYANMAAMVGSFHTKSCFQSWRSSKSVAMMNGPTAAGLEDLLLPKSTKTPQELFKDREQVLRTADAQQFTAHQAAVSGKVHNMQESVKDAIP